MTDLDPLTQRALHARASLRDATAARPVPSPGRSPVRSVRTVSGWAPAMAGAAVVALVLVAFLGGSQSPRQVVTPGAVTSVEVVYYRPDYTHVYRVDVNSGAVRLLMMLPWSETPTEMAWAFGSLWITNFDTDTVWRVDPDV